MSTAVFVLLCLFLINGMLVMTEIALVSARKSKLDYDAQAGDKLAKLALEQANNPSNILSTIQVGVTLIGILTGVFSAAEFSRNASEFLMQVGLSPSLSSSLSVLIIVTLVTFFSMLIGELVPKKIGLVNPERIIKLMVRPVLALAYLTYPISWVLSVCSELILKLLRIKPSVDSKVTEEEIKAMIQEGTEDGEVQEIEQDIVGRVFHLGDLKIESLMTHHSDLIWLDIHDTAGQMREKMREELHSVYPVCRGDLDDVVGVVFIKDIFLDNICQENFDVQQQIKPAQFILETLSAYETLELFKQNKIHYGLVIDEYGSTVGMVTLNDILEAIVGDFNEPSPDELQITQREDGSWLADGQMPFYEFAYEFNIQGFDKGKIKFNTLAGLAMSVLRHIPKAGEKFKWKDFEFEIIDLDGNRIDKLIIRRSEE